MQNLPVAGVIAPHCGQWNSMGAPHSIQNLALSGFSNRHFVHCISCPPGKALSMEAGTLQSFLWMLASQLLDFSAINDLN
jgi:hypothetical protein